MRLPIPPLEVDRARLLHDLTSGVVDPMARKRAGSDHFVLRRAVRADRERERRPGGRRADPEERPASHRPRSGEAGATANGLDKADGVRTYLRFRLKHLEGDAGNPDALRPSSEGRRTDQPTTLVAKARDAAVLHLDPCRQLVGLAKPILITEPLEVARLEAIRRSLVVMANPELERQLRKPLDRIRRDPRDGGDGRLNTHHDLLVVGATVNDLHTGRRSRCPGRHYASHGVAVGVLPTKASIGSGIVRETMPGALATKRIIPSEVRDTHANAPPGSQ